MPPGRTYLNPELLDYLLAHSLRETEVQLRLREETARHERAQMQIDPEQGQFMALLVRLLGAQRILEIGTFTGYSALAMALALPSNGRLLTCDLSEQDTAVARRAWRDAGVEERIELRLGDALVTLDGLLAEGAAGSFDIAFIDADKESYESYYEACLQLLKKGGLILVDNVLWGGRVIDPQRRDADTEAIRAFNVRRRDDRRVDLSMLPVGDGLTLARKR